MGTGLTITTTSLPNGVVSSAYSQALASGGGTGTITWSISAGSLPTSLTLTGNTISGTPSAAGTFNFTVKATDSTTPTPQTATQALSIVVGPALAITTTSLPNGVVSSAYSQTLASSGGAGTITWSISAGSLPTSLTLTGSTISGTPSAAGTFNFTVKATDSSTPTPQTATQALSIVVGPALAITTTSLPNGVVSSAYSQALASSGGTGTITWSISAGSLPTSLTLTGNTISGTPSAAGTFNFTVKATDSSTPTPQTATQALSIVVGPALAITTTSLPNGVVSSAYSQALASSGGTGTITWSISAGSLPTSLTLTGNTISGTPSAAGTFNFTVKATDSTTPTAQTATQVLSIVVGPALTITTTSLSNGVVSSAYSQTLAASGGTGTIIWSISAGSLPTSLTLTGNTISGTPSAAGTFNFTVKATDSSTPTPQTATQALSIVVGPALAITTTSLPNGVVSSAYSQALASSGGTGTITWSISAGSLPTSLTLTGSTISGTPSAAGTFNFTVKATDSTTPTAQTAIQALSITVGTGLTITTTSLPNGVVSSAYSQTLASSGGTGTITWSISAGSLPASLTLTGNTISGTPGAAGTFNFTVKATDSTTPTAQTATQALSIVVGPALTITTTSLPNGVVSSAYSQALASGGGTGTITWSISAGSLPTSLTLTGSTISGTPSAAGTFNFTVKATDSTTPTAQTATQALSIVVGPALTITTTSLSNGVVSSAYSQTLASSGGTGTITWSISAGSLPTSLTLTGSTISGTPSAAGTFNFTVKATDSTTPTAQTATQALSIVVGPALTITTTSLPNGVVSSAYSQTLASSGGAGTITWSISAGSLPASLTLTGSTISGTPSATGTFNFTVKATDSTTPTPQTATQALSIVVGPALTITTTSLPNGVVSSAYSQTLASSGGAGTITWSISAGSLPASLTLTGNTISGTPSAAGTFNFTVKATDSTTPTAQTATQVLSIVVGPALAITTTSLPNGVVSSAYSQALASSGGTGTIIWSISAGSLPTSLTLTGNTISGTPSAAGTFNFTVKATDSSTPTPQTATQALSIVVGPALAITTTSLPNGVVSSAYSQALASSGGTGTITWSISAGSLPTSLTLTGSTISGTPSAAGTFNFTVKATDSTTPTAQTATQALSITVGPKLTITTTTLPNGLVSSAYSQTLASSGGTGAITWSISAGSLPTSLTLTGNTISGTPSATGTFNFTVKATDSSTPTAQIATQALSITIVAPLSVMCPATTTGTVGFAFNSGTESVTGGTPSYVFSIVGGIGNLPAGLNLNTTNGTVSGGPTATGTFSIQVTDANGITNMACSITILPTLAITTTSLPQGSPGVPYSFQPQVVGGIGTLTWAFSGLPGNSGLNGNTSTGLISGTPRSLTSYQVTITVADSTQPTAQFYTTQPLTLTIAMSPLTVTSNPSPLANALINTVYNAQIVVNGGLSPYNISANTTDPTFPAWLTFDTGGSVCGGNTPGTVGICGTPTSANIGTNTFIVTAIDSNGLTVNQTFSFMVTQPGGVGAMTVQSAPIGQGLQVPLTITFNPPPSFGITCTQQPCTCTQTTPGCLAITSSSGSVALGREGSGGSLQTLVQIPAGTTSVSIYAQAMGLPGSTATITASTPGYTAGTGTVTIANSGFVVSGPNGIGATFNTVQGVQTTLTVSAARLDSNNAFVESEEVVGGATVTVPIASAPSTIGTVSPTSLTFPGGTSSVTTTFKASSVNFGGASVTLTEPTTPFVFNTPAVGGHSTLPSRRAVWSHPL